MTALPAIRQVGLPCDAGLTGINMIVVQKLKFLNNYHVFYSK